MKKENNNEFWQNDRFIRDMLSPDERSEAYWETFLKEHPEKQEEFEQSRLDFNKIKLNNYSLSKEKTNRLLNNIHADYARQKRKKHLRYFSAALMAACLLGLLYIVPSYYMGGLSERNDIVATVPVAALDSIHTEVTLITDNSETIQIKNNSIIACDSNVHIQTGQGLQTLLTKYNTLVVPRGKRSSLVLDDGSKVWVNAGTVLRFPSTFDSDKRTIEVQGEIYIEVAKEKSRPFYVQTPEFTVNVLGTRFNVSAYRENKIQSVVLVEGKVAVRTKEEKEITLKPDQMLTMSQQKNEVNQVDVNDYISWKDGILQFKGESVGDVLKRIGHYYNVQIQCAPSIAGRSCAGELLLFDDIQQVMETFSALYDVKYHFVSDTLFIE